MKVSPSATTAGALHRALTRSRAVTWLSTRAELFAGSGSLRPGGAATVTLLDARERAAWRGFLRVHSGLVRELNAELEATHGLPLAHYEVLFHLEGAPGAKLKMSELAQSVLLSQSGVTRGLVAAYPTRN